MGSKRVLDLDANLAVNILADYYNSEIGGGHDEPTFDEVMEAAALYLVTCGDMRQPSSRQLTALQWIELHARESVQHRARAVIANAILGEGWSFVAARGTDELHAVGRDGRRLDINEEDWPQLMDDSDTDD